MNHNWQAQQKKLTCWGYLILPNNAFTELSTKLNICLFWQSPYKEAKYMYKGWLLLSYFFTGLFFISTNCWLAQSRLCFNAFALLLREDVEYSDNGSQISHSSNTTGSPSSKFEHRRASALLRNIQNIRICMGKKPTVSVTYENERISIKNSSPYLKCVLHLSCVVHGPIYGRFMGFYVSGFLSI